MSVIPSLDDYPGVDPTGAVECSAAVNNAIALITVSGPAALRVPQGKYLVTANPIIIQKPIRLNGDSSICTSFVTGSPTLDTFQIEAKAELFGIKVEPAPGIVRASGAVTLNLKPGGALHLFQSLLDYCATGIMNNSGDVVDIDKSTVRLLDVYGVGVTSNVQQLVLNISRSFFAGVDFETSTQPFCGIDLSRCDNAVISNTQNLVTGYGILQAPAGEGQQSSSVYISNVLNDHCRVGHAINPSAGGLVTTMVSDNEENSTSNYYGLDVTVGAGGKAEDIAFSKLVCESNGKSTNYDGVNIDGAKSLTIENSIIGDSKVADIRVRGVSEDISIINNRIGNRYYPSANNVVLQDACKHVAVLQNRLRGSTGVPIWNGTSGSNNTIGPNL